MTSFMRLLHQYHPQNTFSRTVDNLYALSQFLQVPIDEIVCGNRKAIMPEPIVIIENSRTRRLYAYYKQLNRMLVA